MVVECWGRLWEESEDLRNWVSSNSTSMVLTLKRPLLVASVEGTTGAMVKCKEGARVAEWCTAVGNGVN